MPEGTRINKQLRFIQRNRGVVRTTLATYGEMMRWMWSWLRTNRYPKILLAIIILQQLALAWAFCTIRQEQKWSLAIFETFRQALQDEKEKNALQPNK